MKSNEKKTGVQILQELFEDQRAGARDQNHPIHDRLKASLKAQQERLYKNKNPQSKD